MNKRYTDKERRQELIKWFKENCFLEERVRYYILIFDKISKLKDIDIKREKYLEFQTEILDEFDNRI
ncbi:MAG: hypothetical protein ACRDBY_11300 [Cetobacterium sp.]|uniref:hypothetical protein n=1 Tax=Cetobacterium sp. TaxID=2071632 RepID=UPI003F2D138D